MVKNYTANTFVSIDVGTTKICVLVAHAIDNDLTIIGIGKSPSDGLKKGVVVDVAKTIQSIKTAVKEAEIMAGLRIESACVGISGGHIHSTNSHGVVPIKHGQISSYDVASVLAAARAIPIPEGQQILHVLPQYFIIDSREKVQNPLGMHGIRLEVQAHIIMGAIASVQNLIKCCQLAGVMVSDIILEQLASADAVLSPDEKEIGVAVLDIGGGTSDLALYQNNSIRHTMVLPVAGNHFTNDLAVGLHTSLKDAERIKKEAGIVSSFFLDENKQITVEHIGEKGCYQTTQKIILRILQSRAQELLHLIHEEITSKHLEPFMPCGLVITGGGSLLCGAKELAQDIFKVPVRIGHLSAGSNLPESLNSPIYATGYGLLVHMCKLKSDLLQDMSTGPMVKRVYLRMKSWVSDFF